MATVTIAGALAIEAQAKKAGWTEERLLDEAGANLAAAIVRYFPYPGHITGFLGKGHNAGDALVAMRILRDRHSWEISLRAAQPMDTAAPLTIRKWHELGAPPPAKGPLPRPATGPWVLLDGLLGTGSKGALRPPLLVLAAEMGRLRQTGGARVAAIDLPSGVDADTGEIHEGAVIADVTFMIANAKAGLLTGAAARATGALALVELPALAARQETDLELIAPQCATFGKSPRPFDFHKGMAGRVAILAGSADYTGAAVMAASGALRGGGGLITLFVPSSSHGAVSAKCPPEIIVRSCDDPRELLGERADAWVVGCGLGKMADHQTHGLFELIERSGVPLVIDADALNAIARAGKTGILSTSHVITPHPGEFRRLAPDLADLTREDAARAFVARFPATLLLKGCRTIVARSGCPLRINATGSPGMATGGQGDLLAGVIGARLAAGDSLQDAASLGAWICGRAAEIAQTDPAVSEDSLTPTDVADFLGAAFNDWRASRR